MSKYKREKTFRGVGGCEYLTDISIQGKIAKDYFISKIIFKRGLWLWVWCRYCEIVKYQRKKLDLRDVGVCVGISTQ